MGDNTNYLISLLFNKTENVMYIKIYMSFYSENSLLLFYPMSPEKELANQI